MKLLEFNIFSGEINDIFLQEKKQCVINTINPHSYIVSLSDSRFNNALKSSDILLPDGSGILLASRIISGKKIKKLTGPTVLEYALDYYNKTSAKVYFLGASENTLSKIRKKIKKKYKNIEVKTFSPSFSVQLSQGENKSIIKDIDKFQPDLLCIGMTAPKQEKWVFENKSNLPNCHIMSVGAAFDWFSEVKKQPSKFSRRFHLAWLERFVREPIRMMPRIKSMIFFLYIVFKIKIKKTLKLL